MKEIVECVFRNTIYTCLCKWAKMKEISSQNVHKFLNQLKYWMVSNNYYATLNMDSYEYVCVCSNVKVYKQKVKNSHRKFGIFI